MLRSHYSSECTSALINQEVRLCGWVHRRRDHGGVIFVDLRDRTGLLQCVFQPEQAEVFKLAESIRNEFVLEIHGRLRARPQGTVNADLASGEIECAVSSLIIHARAENLPFAIDDYDDNLSEAVRLRHRVLDLRRPKMMERLVLRAQVKSLMRNFLEQAGFLDIETPFLTKSTPEGARDYLVPSRTHPGEFFALPQSPQLFKQLLMISGFDRYYQIVRCFRDEDLRADRQPEFTQLDIETSFMNEADIQQLIEQLVCHIFEKSLQVKLPAQFPKMTYQEAMSRFGSDKPDLRIPLEMVEITDLMKAVEFKVFAQAAQMKNGKIAVMRVPNAAEVLSRSQIDEYTKFVADFGAKGLAYIKVTDHQDLQNGLQSPIVKFLPAPVLQAILTRSAAQNGDLLFFGADHQSVVHAALGALRVRLGHDLKLIQGEWAPLWVVDFPMFEYDEQQKRWLAVHHPFTAPQPQSLQDLKSNPERCLARAYDFVLNGFEIGGGSIRIHTTEMQQTVFHLLGIDAKEAQLKFGFLLDALSYGAPPHGGVALGVDRLLMLMSGAESIRDVIAYPKTQTASCPLTHAPSAVDPKQLLELGIRLAKPALAQP